MTFFSKLTRFFSAETPAVSAEEILLESYKDDAINSTISEEAAAAYNRQRVNGPQKMLCSAPFKNLYFSRHGQVFSCCHSRDYVAGKYPAQSIAEIWNGDKLEKFRKYIAGNNLSLGCQVCQADFDRRAYGEVKANHFDQLPLHRNYPSMMEFELDTTCNLECTMCSGEFSSSIRKNRENLSPLVSPYDESFVEELLPFIPYLHETRFSGGEPFLVPIYFKIWDKIIEINPTCIISLQTNGTVMNTKIQALLQKGRFEIGISLDSMQKEVFESIRINAKFETVMKQVNFFAAYCREKNTSFRLSMCVMHNNWHEMPGYVKLCNQLNAYASFHKVINPERLAIWNLSSEELFKITGYLEQFDFYGEDITPVSSYNIGHYKSYRAQVRLWAEKKLQDEVNEKSWTDLPVAGVRTRFEQVLENKMTELKIDDTEIQYVRSNFSLLIGSFSFEKQHQLLLALKNYNTNVIVQRLRLKSVDELKEEVKRIFPKLVE